MPVIGPIGPPRTFAQMKDDQTSGLMVGDTDDGGVGMARIVDGDVMWREEWDLDEAEAIAREVLRLVARRRTTRRNHA